MLNIIKPKNKPVMEGDEAALYLDATEVDISPIKERATKEFITLRKRGVLPAAVICLKNANHIFSL